MMSRLRVTPGGSRVTCEVGGGLPVPPSRDSAGAASSSWLSSRNGTFHLSRDVADGASSILAGGSEGLMHDKMNLTDDPITTEIGLGRARKLCRCAFCDYTAVCLPEDDFYSISGPVNPTGGPLACEQCMLAGKVSGSRPDLAKVSL